MVSPSYIGGLGRKLRPSEEELKHGGEFYECVAIWFQGQSVATYLPSTLKATIAHELIHLRWRTLKHGPEFEARTAALLRNASFSRGRWCNQTRQIMTETRSESAKWIRDRVLTKKA